MKTKKELEENAKLQAVIDPTNCENLDEYPHYPISEDIFTHDKYEEDLNPEDVSKNKASNENEGRFNEKTFHEDMSGDDLDVPGSELDNQQENIGSEDEENNYYSLGGDAHNNLDEDSN